MCQIRKTNSLVAIALVFIFLCGFTANAQTLKLMTYNIRLDVAVDGDNDWNHRKDFFSSQIQFYAPDIFGIQEALPNQVTDLENTLRNYDHVGIGRDGEGKGEASAISTIRHDSKLRTLEHFGFRKHRIEFPKVGTLPISESAPMRYSKTRKPGERFGFSTHISTTTALPQETRALL